MSNTTKFVRSQNSLILLDREFLPLILTSIECYQNDLLRLYDEIESTEINEEINKLDELILILKNQNL